MNVLSNKKPFWNKDSKSAYVTFYSLNTDFLYYGNMARMYDLNLHFRNFGKLQFSKKNNFLIIHIFNLMVHVFVLIAHKYVILHAKIACE